MSRVCPVCQVTPLPSRTMCEHCLIAQIRSDCESRIAELQRQRVQSAEETASKIAAIEKATIAKSQRIMTEADRRCEDLRRRQRELQRVLAIEKQAPNPSNPNAQVVGCATDVLTKSSVDKCKFCPICYEEFDGTQRCVYLSCSHIFHLHCLNAWMEKSNTCPECRRPIQQVLE